VISEIELAIEPDRPIAADVAAKPAILRQSMTLCK